jgi:L-lactate dehydrogenase complex protein LldE
MDVHIFIPCFMDQLYPNTALNMVKILERYGCTVHYNNNQTCCGQPAYNAGYKADAKEVCTKFLKDFEKAKIIVTPSASCAGFLHSYYPTIFDNSSLHNDAKSLKTRVLEFTDFLVNHLNVTDLGATLNKKATYHDSCAALREYKLDKTIPRQLLQHVKGLTLVEMKDNETCCGFGGTFAVKFSGISTAMADQKIANASEVEAEVIISTDVSCLMHIQGFAAKQKNNITTMHIADVLASGW